jgi:hypothetical protein
MREKIAEILSNSTHTISINEAVEQILALIPQEINTHWHTQYVNLENRLKEMLEGIEVEEECAYNDNLLCGANEKGIGDCYHPATPDCHGTGTISRPAEWRDLKIHTEAATEGLFVIVPKSGGRLKVKK